MTTGRFLPTALLTLTAALAVAASFTVRAQDKAQDDEENWKPEKITNLKVLAKDTTPEQIMTIMKAYSAALNVSCVACHKGKVDAKYSEIDYADDAKENKDVTRSMIQMTLDLNTKYPDGLPDATAAAPAITCATCHRRNRHPETELPPKGD
jgi:cytochrome c553